MGAITKLQSPVTKEEFFDRENILKSLLQVDRNVVLIGPRKGGKTSLLKQFALEYKSRSSGGAIICYYYIRFEETLDIFRYKFLNAVLEAYLEDKGVDTSTFPEPATMRFRVLQTHLVTYIPELANKFLDITDTNISEDEKTQSFLTIAYHIAKHEKRDFIIILDEFQNVVDFSVSIPDIMRELMLSKGGIYYYLAGSETGLMDELVNKYDVPLFGHFENHRVDYFDYPDARQFALYLGKSLNLLINENYLNYLITLTGGFPFYLRVLMYELSNVLNERENRFVGKEDVVKALSKSLFSSYAILYKYFEESLEVNLRRKKSGRYYQILKAIGDKKLNVTELSKLTNVRVTSLPTYLEYLVKTELLKKDKEKYYVNDPLMRFWLSNAFEIEESRIMNLEGEIENFNKKVRQMIDTYKSELGLAREAQVRETFVLSNKYKRVRGGMINGVELDIISSEKDKLVLGEIKIKIVTGYDVEKFLRKVKGIQDEVGIKIFVGLMGAEKEAMRLMRREKVKFYDLEAINKIRKEYKLGIIKV